jgi:dTDP-glucose pyrophosphorylase
VSLCKSVATIPLVIASVTRVVVLARGLGSRMRQDGGVALRADQAAAAAAGAKAMMPVGDAASGAGRPFLDFVLSALADAGYRQVCLVVGPEHAEIRRYYTEAAPPTRVQVEFAEQAEPRGTADAVAAAEPFIADHHVLIINGDNYYPPGALAMLHQSNGPATALFRAESLVVRGNIAPERLRAFAIGVVDADGMLARIVEKPDERQFAEAGANPLVSMNCWVMPPSIVRACRSIPPSSRGEFELTHAVAYAIDTLGVRIRVMVSDEGVLDLSRRDDVAAVGSRLAALTPRP